MSADRPVNSIFQQPWWLDAVAPGRWDAVEIRSDGGDLDAWMPYVIRLDKWGLKVIDMPDLTMTLGPWISPSQAEQPRKKLAHDMAMLGELADGLPEADLCRQRFSPSIPTAVPFGHRGYRMQVAYTYRIGDLTDEEAMLANMSSQRRKQIRRAAKVVEVEPTDDLDVFLRVNRMTFERQGLEPPYSDDYVRRIDDACRANNAREILIAKDESGNVHAVSYDVFDDNTTFALMAGIDPEFRKSHAGSLLNWEGIRRSAARSKVYDFEGGTSPSVSPFVASFGAELIPYVVVVKESRRWRALELARDQGRSGVQQVGAVKERLTSRRKSD